MELIKDRTWADVTQGTEKGFYGSGDMNRVEQAVEQIGSHFPALGIGLRLTTRTDWTPETRPERAELERYLANVAAIRDALSPGLPLPESMSYLTWLGANQIEQALQQADTTARNIMCSWRYSGQLYAGEERED